MLDRVITAPVCIFFSSCATLDIKVLYRGSKYDPQHFRLQPPLHRASFIQEEYMKHLSTMYLPQGISYMLSQEYKNAV